MEPTVPDVAALNQLEIDFLILADRAEAVNGKLYMMGGGWDRTLVDDINQPVVFSFAVGILVPWNATNHTHSLEIKIENLDGTPTDFRLQAQFNQGRQPWLTLGETQRVMLAIPGIPVKFPGLGSYVAVARINGTIVKRTPFHLAPKADYLKPPAP